MMKKILVLVMALMPTMIALAQPQVSRRNTTTQPKSATTTSTTTSTSTTTQATPKKKTATKVSEPTVDRASIMFPTAVTVPQDVSWRRDIYRALDLTQDANAPLYFPVDPQGDRVNLFTLLFQLLNEGKIPAYKYSLDGLENFNKENRMHFKEFLDDNGIDYEIQGNSIKVEPADIPSALVTRFNIKESTYYDQNTATFHSRVIAICPVIQKADDFDFGDDSAFDMSDEETNEEGGMDEAVANEPLPKRNMPLFWVKVEDVAPYLSQHMIMTSNYNNAATCSMADFFDTNMYKGTIYMTTNMQNKILQEQYANPKDLKKEQDRIEKQLSDFEKNIWENPVDSAKIAERDSLASLQKKAKKVKVSKAPKENTEVKKTAKAEKTKSASSSSPSTPRVSVRRQRH